MKKKKKRIRVYLQSHEGEGGLFTRSAMVSKKKGCVHLENWDQTSAFAHLIFKICSAAFNYRGIKPKLTTLIRCSLLMDGCTRFCYINWTGTSVIHISRSHSDLKNDVLKAKENKLSVCGCHGCQATGGRGSKCFKSIQRWFNPPQKTVPKHPSSSSTAPVPDEPRQRRHHR